MAKTSEQAALIVGGGKMARHWEFYLHNLGFTTTVWTRAKSSQKKPEQISAYFSGFSTIFLAISDDALTVFHDTFLSEHSGSIFHFSGAYSHHQMLGVHPLMTFGKDLYSADFYKSIALNLDFSSQHPFIEKLPNPKHILSSKDKALYHSYCVMAGNFPQWLWQNLFTELEQLNIPREALLPFLQQSLNNTFKAGDGHLSGPLIRNDQSTLAKHQTALDGHHLSKIYNAFVQTAKENPLKITSSMPEPQK